MIIAQEDLNRWRVFVEQVRNATFNVRMAVSRRDVAKANETLSELHDAAIVAGMGMEQAGAERPDSLPSPSSVRLEHLSTPANRQYLGALRAAYDAALAVDRERFGENIGTDGCAQAIELILRDVEQECFGAVGRLRE